MDEAIYLCGVPYNADQGHTNFCLCSRVPESRWEFHCIEVKKTDETHLLIDSMKQHLGLDCRIVESKPVGTYRASRSQKPGTVHAYLIEVLEEEEESSSMFRKKWCRAEEAKIRIRRKPVRWLVDSAIAKITLKKQSEESPSE